MDIKNKFGLITGWAMLTLLAIAVVVGRIIKHSPYHIALIIAILMFILLIYLLILRRIDGPSFAHSLHDERLWHISVKAQRNSFWFLFISIWGLAVIMEFYNPDFLKEYISLILAAIGTLGLVIFVICFVWQKYRVED
ncbi:MAG: DUF2178 domain-containing protein [Syntrophomonadaceae bacterium]|nr:DUF2178 domain-containing protein [Syntrophomonadaceae bacterium]